MTPRLLLTVKVDPLSDVFSLDVIFLVADVNRAVVQIRPAIFGDPSSGMVIWNKSTGIKNKSINTENSYDKCVFSKPTYKI